MRFVSLQSFLTCDTTDCKCDSDWGCSSAMTVTAEDHKRISKDLAMYNTAVKVHDTAEVITLINRMRDIRWSCEPLHSPDSIEYFLGLLDQHNIQKVLFIDLGEQMELVFPIIDENLLELITHPSNLLRQLCSGE